MMRFSLFWLLALVAVIRMLCQYGLTGLFFLPPHFFIVWTVAASIRRTKYIKAWSVASLFMLSWLIAAAIGVPRTNNRLTQKIKRNCYNHEAMNQLSVNPFLTDVEAGEPPWYHVINRGSPCPFFVSTDWGVMAGPVFGSGGRRYSLWFPGYSIKVYDQFHWNS